MGVVHVIFDVTGGLALALVAFGSYTMRKLICGLVMSALPRRTGRPRRAEKAPRPQHAKIGAVEDVNILTREAPVSGLSRAPAEDNGESEEQVW